MHIILNILKYFSRLYFISLLLLSISFYYFFLIYPPYFTTGLLIFVLKVFFFISLAMVVTVLPGLLLRKRYNLFLFVLVLMSLSVGLAPHSQDSLEYYSFLRYLVSSYLIYLLYLNYGKHYLLNKYYYDENIVNPTERILLLFIFIIFITLYNPFLTFSIFVNVWRAIDICLILFLIYLEWNHKVILRNLLQSKHKLKKKIKSDFIDYSIIKKLYLHKYYAQIIYMEYKEINTFDNEFSGYLNDIEIKFPEINVSLSFLDRFFLNFNCHTIIIKDGNFVTTK